MLTCYQVLKLYGEGTEMLFSRKHVHRGLKGEYDPSLGRIIVYIQNIDSLLDRDLTILHEHIHARDDVKSRRVVPSSREEEQRVEHEARETYLKRKSVLALILQFHRGR